MELELAVQAAMEQLKQTYPFSGTVCVKTPAQTFERKLRVRQSQRTNSELATYAVRERYRFLCIRARAGINNEKSGSGTPLPDFFFDA